MLPAVWAGSSGESCRYNQLAHAQDGYQTTEQGEEGYRKLPWLPGGGFEAVEKPLPVAFRDKGSLLGTTG